ncbi:MAG: GNAT family N-acetyltransferase [Clostridiales bacterium]|nr:GNAT family N-acetyltransferase [Clostridiales bacterium]
MDELRLVMPSLDYEAQLLLYKRETLEIEPVINGASGLADLTVPQWLDQLEQRRKPETCPPGLVPDSTFLCIRTADDRLVGMINIRHVLNDYLRDYGGHIGYSIRPNERGQGYGKEQLRLGLLACGRLGISPVLLTVEPWNHASQGVIRALGGQYEDSRTTPEGKTMMRFWIAL